MPLVEPASKHLISTHCSRDYGNNNLPDSSNMCHETTSVALKKVIGAPVGTSVYEDFSTCDAIFFFGQTQAPTARVSCILFRTR